MRVKPKKRLGQNFLVDKNIQRKIIESLGLKKSDIILEIGAGRGELTVGLAQKAGKVYALEIDSNLCAVLKENLKGYPNVEIINQDILKFNPDKYLNKPAKNGKLKVFGNIPYYISSPIIERLIKMRAGIEVVFITVQKEFARRIIAQPHSKDYGAFSCFVQYYAECKIIFNIKKGSFFPMPKVDSSLVSLRVRQEPSVRPVNETLFFKIIRASFNKRRKTLRNSLAGVIPPEKLKGFFSRYNINSKVRPEDLSLEDFANLTNIP